MVPEILPFKGVTAEPVTHEKSAFGSMFTNVGDDLDGLVAVEMGKGPKGVEIKIKWGFVIHYLRNETIGKVSLNKPHFGVATVIVFGLTEEVLVDVQSHVVFQHDLCDCLGNIFVNAWIFGGDPHNQIIAITATAPQVQYTYTFQSFTFALH